MEEGAVGDTAREGFQPFNLDLDTLFVQAWAGNLNGQMCLRFAKSWIFTESKWASWKSQIL